MVQEDVGSLKTCLYIIFFARVSPVTSFDLEISIRMVMSVSSYIFLEVSSLITDFTFS